MMARPLPADEMILDLMAIDATIGLGDRDAAKLADYFANHSDEDRDGFAMAATAIQLATLPRIAPMPIDIRGRLCRDARALFGAVMPPLEGGMTCITPKRLTRGRPSPYDRDTRAAASMPERPENKRR